MDRAIGYRVNGIGMFKGCSRGSIIIIKSPPTTKKHKHEKIRLPKIYEKLLKKMAVVTPVFRCFCFVFLTVVGGFNNNNNNSTP